MTLEEWAKEEGLSEPELFEILAQSLTNMSANILNTYNKNNLVYNSYDSNYQYSFSFNREKLKLH